MNKLKITNELLNKEKIKIYVYHTIDEKSGFDKSYDLLLNEKEYEIYQKLYKYYVKDRWLQLMIISIVLYNKKLADQMYNELVKKEIEYAKKMEEIIGHKWIVRQ